MVRTGGCTFAEDPLRDARSARIIWRAGLDPGTLFATALPGDPADPEALVVARLLPWLSVVSGDGGIEHAVLSNGHQRIRLDVTGRISGQEAVNLRFDMGGMASAAARVLPLRRLIALHQRGRFGAMLFPTEPHMPRWITVLRARDAMLAGASQRDIALVLFGEDQVMRQWREGEGALRARVRRLVNEATRMATGGWRSLMRKV